MVSQAIEKKAREIVNSGLIIDRLDYFLVLPLGRNKLMHKVTINDNQEWQCDCQFFRTTGLPCSHILAVKKYLEVE